MCRNCISTIWSEPEDKYKPDSYDRKRALEERDDDAYGMDDQISWGHKRRREPHEACSRISDTQGWEHHCTFVMHSPYSRAVTPRLKRCAPPPPHAMNTPLLKRCAPPPPTPTQAACTPLLRHSVSPCSSAVHLPTQAQCNPWLNAAHPPARGNYMTIDLTYFLK